MHRIMAWAAIAVTATLALGSLGGCTKTPEQLVVDLGDPQTLVREKARVALIELDTAAIPALLAGLDTAEAYGGIEKVLLAIGEETYAPCEAKLSEACRADPVNDQAITVLMNVMEEVGTPKQILSTYLAAVAEGGAVDKYMLKLLLRIEPPKDDVTIDPGMNLRYAPVRFTYKKDPDLATSRALARVCLHDTKLGAKTAEMNRDKDEEIYWNQWRMRDPLVRAMVSRYMTDDIYHAYHDNFAPTILKEERAANAEDPLVAMGELATVWRKRNYDTKAPERITLAYAGFKTYFATNPHTYDEPCLVYTTLEELAKPVRSSLDENRRKREMKALDEALVPLVADRELACAE